MARDHRAYDDLFRFKIDFVRRRALPLLKGGARVEATAADHALVAALARLTPEGEARLKPDGEVRLKPPDAELALARAGCALLDREEAPASRAARPRRPRWPREIESLKRWCAAHVHDPRLSRTGSCSASPRRSTPSTWCTSGGPIRRCRRRWSVPTSKLRRRDGFKLTDARFTDAARC